MQYGDQVMAKPVSGIDMRKENGQRLAPEGETVVLNGFWKRRELDGDVTLSLPPKTKKSDQAA